MTNWKDIHPNFTRELQKDWEDKGFSYEECKAWAKVLDDKFEITNYEFCAWLKNKKNLTTETLDYDDLDSLIDEYNNSMEESDDENEELKNIHPDFTGQLKEEWESWIYDSDGKKLFSYEEVKEWKIRGFTPEQTKEWLDIGLQTKDANFCAWLKNFKKTNPEEILNHDNLEQLRQEHTTYLQQQQQRILKNWSRLGFNHEEINSWVKIGIFSQEFDYAFYLKEKYQTPEESLKHGGIREELEREYINFSRSEWGSIHLGFSTVNVVQGKREALWRWWSQQGFSSQLARQWVEAGVNPREIEFVVYLQEKDYHSSVSDIEKIRKEYNNQKLEKWFDKNHLQENRKEIKQIFIVEKLEGELDLKDFINLEKIYIPLAVNKLKIKNQPVEKIETIETINAQEYVDWKYPTTEDKTNCEFLNLGAKNENNPNGIERNLLEGSLFLKGFTNLKTLWCGGQKITELDLSECFHLEDLKCWGNELTNLDVSNCLKLKMIGCAGNKLTNLDLTGLDSLESLNCQDNQLINLNLSQNEQLNYLNCPKNKLTNLNLSECQNLTEVHCQDNQLTNLDLNSCSKSEIIYCGKNIITNPDCHNLSKLTELWCQQNQLVQLTLPTSSNLEKLVCWKNLLTDLDFSVLNPKKLTVLGLSDNNFFERDLNCFTFFTKLKELHLANYIQVKINQNTYNRWTGSLNPLKNMYQLEKLSIDNTDLNTGAEYLPDSIIEIKYSTQARPKSKVSEIKKELDWVNKGNLKELKKWKELGFSWEEIKSWTETGLKVDEYEFVSYLKRENLDSQKMKKSELDELRKEFLISKQSREEISKFIQWNQPKITNSSRILEKIPYEQFTNVKYLTQGGFGRIYKAEWNLKNVVLKKLNNSRNTPASFLQEVANHKLFSGGSIVDCYGISRDPKTEDFIMVMEYIKGGNLKEYLKNNYRQLDFKKKLIQLYSIADGLNSIHEKGLLHKDFHPGNILSKGSDNFFADLVCYITDLGLCRPANEKDEDKNKVYGVLPYVAPEVLRNEKYAKSADVYSWSIVAYEVLTGLPPYVNHNEKEGRYEGVPHDELLNVKIRGGLRPKFNIRIPPLLKDLIESCWNTDPLKRPRSSHLKKVLGEWVDEINEKKQTEFFQQIQEVEKYNQNLSDKIKFPICKEHSGAIYTSRSLGASESLPYQLLKTSENLSSCKINSLSLSASEHTGLTTGIKRGLSFSETDRPNKSIKLDCGKSNSLDIPVSDEVITKISQLQAELEQERAKNADLQKKLEVYQKILKTYLESEKEKVKKLEAEVSELQVYQEIPPSLIAQWQQNNFTYQQIQDWINAGFQSTDYNFCTWLKNTKHLTPETTLNHHNYQELQAEYRAYQSSEATLDKDAFQSHTLQPPK